MIAACNYALRESFVPILTPMHQYKQSFLLKDAQVGQVCADLISEDLTRIASFTRLAFHDCVGGCDGCVDTSLRPNSGLYHFPTYYHAFCILLAA